MLKRNGITMLIIALLLLTAYGSFVPAEASPITGVDNKTADVSHAQGEPVTIQFLTIDDPQELVALDKMAKAFVRQRSEICQRHDPIPGRAV